MVKYFFTTEITYLRHLNTAQEVKLASVFCRLSHPEPRHHWQDVCLTGGIGGSSPEDCGRDGIDSSEPY